MFKWGDGTDSGWTEFVPSGTPISRSHRWLKEGKYIVKVRAKDDFGAVSEWSEPRTCLIPKSRNIYDKNLFVRFLDSHPYLFPILQQLFRL